MQSFFVFLKNSRHFGNTRIGRFAVHLLRRLLLALGMADLREGSAIRHRFLIEPHPPVSGLDDGELILIVVDGKRPRKSRTNGCQPISISPQHSHTEGVECRNPRRPFKMHFLQQRRHPRPHLPGGFVGKRDREYRRRRHMLRADQVRNPMRDDAGLTAARPSQDQHRAFGSFDRFTLLGIEARKEVHYRTIFALAGIVPQNS